MSDSKKLPKWVLKILPVLTGHIYLLDFEKWIYSPASENCFSKEFYLELISFNYKKGSLSDFLNCLSNFMSFEQRLSLCKIVDFLQEPYYLDYIDNDDFNLLPVSDVLLNYALLTMKEMSERAFLAERLGYFEDYKKIRQLLFEYAENVIFLLNDYENRTIIGIMGELNKVYNKLAIIYSHH